MQADEPIVGLATAIQLMPDSTTVYLTDYFSDIKTIDSLVPNKELKMVRMGDSLRIFGDVKNPLSELTVISKGTPYTIVIKKNCKIKHKFSFNAAGKTYTSVQIKGGFNNWNANKGNFALQPSGNYEFSTFVNPSNHQYKLVLNGKEASDPYSKDSVSNGFGAFNNVLKLKDEGVQPMLFAQSFSGEGIEISANGVFEYLVLWQNQKIAHKTNGKTASITIPKIAQGVERSFIRVLAHNGTQITNDLLIPLQNGKVLDNTAQIKRTDKHAYFVYNIMIDRFYNGNTTNDKPLIDARVLPKVNYFGGDIAGITQKIKDGFFQKLGINTVWVSPVVQNPTDAWGYVPKPGTKFSGYHGYWPIALTKIDTRFGTDTEFKELLSVAHSNNMNVLVDYVGHHIHVNHPFFKQHPDWYTSLYLPDGTKNTERWDDQRLTTWFDDFLPTFNYFKPEVVNTMTDTAVYWLKNYDIDGFRHDATKHVPEQFWRALTQKTKNQIIIPQKRSVYQIGETYGSPELISAYVSSGQMDGQFDFNLTDATSGAFIFNQSCKNLANTVQESGKYYGSHHLMGAITGNQDRPRIISFADGSVNPGEDTKLAGWKRNIQVKDTTAYKKVAMHTAFIATMPGIPIIYYGDEIGMPGANDPDSRRLMVFEGLNTAQNRLKNQVAQLAMLRKNNLALIYGDTYVLASTDDVIVYLRKYFGQWALVAINKSTKPTNFTFVPEMVLDIKNFKANFGQKATAATKGIELNLAPQSFEVVTSNN